MIEKYLEEKSLVWSSSTLNTEGARLRKYAELLKTSPSEALAALQDQGMAPYSIKTLFIRLGDYQEWLGQDAPSYKKFVKNNGSYFRRAYQKETINVTFDQVKSEIEGLSSGIIKDHLIFLLKSGLRISESYKVKPGDKIVVGKGGVQRPIFAEVPAKKAKAHVLRSVLKEMDIKPHTLRKLLATKLVERGFAPQELCRIMGWTNMQTAMSYLQSRSDKQLQEVLNGITN